MTREEALEWLKFKRNSLIDDNATAQLVEALDIAIKALSEPTIPLSAIEKIHNAIDNADSDGFLEDEHGYYIGSMLTKEHVDEIIDKAVKECTYE